MSLTSCLMWKRKGCRIALFFLLLLLLNSRNIELVTARSVTAKKSLEMGKLKGTVKTIVVGKDDIIDCVDIYKQPAFDHPLLKNHTLQMPHPIPSTISNESTTTDVLKNLLKIEKCPPGTVPIKRKQNNWTPSTSQFYTSTVNPLLFGGFHEHASISLGKGKYYGSDSRMNFWHPVVAKPGEFSKAQTWLISGYGHSTNALQAGWEVRYNQPTRLFIYWTANGYHNGCYNLECPGFIQTHPRYFPGIGLEPVSKYNGVQYFIDIAIIQDRASKAWKLLFRGTEIGYWPSAIVPKCADGVEDIHFGGEVLNKGVSGRHTRTQMGSGHFSSYGSGKASYIGHLAYYDKNGNRIEPKYLHYIMTNPGCYDADIFNKTEFYYGGPGYDQMLCQ